MKEVAIPSGFNVEPVNVKKELEKIYKNSRRFRGSQYFKPNEGGYQSSFFDEYSASQSIYGNLKTADRALNREVDCRTLRRVSKKAWIINLCINNVQKKIKPFLKPSTSHNLRGFVIKKVGEDVVKAAGQRSKDRETIERFLLNCGYDESEDGDNFVRYCLKITRDALEIDQVASEILYTRAGSPYGFCAVDGGTIEKVMPNQDNPYNIKFVQLINNIPTAYYPEGTLIFDYQNPRTDIEHPFYGYSYVEQAIDLITSAINAFAYNAGFFTENKLPRGMLLIDGNASTETVEQMEDYIVDIMSGTTANQWRIPIIPAGNGKGGDNNSIKWISLSGTNKEMEFQGWLDFLTSAIVSLFGCSMEELGLHSAKSQPMFERNTTPQIEASKSLVLGDTLGFLQQYINRIIKKVFPGYELEFVGYEREDPEKVLELAKKEMESFKVLNEVRKEKGLKPIDAKWADECPANPQLVQLYQAAQMDGGMEDMEDEEGLEDGEDMENADFGQEQIKEEDFGQENTSENEDEWDSVEEGQQLEKSLTFGF